MKQERQQKIKGINQKLQKIQAMKMLEFYRDNKKNASALSKISTSIKLFPERWLLVTIDFVQYLVKEENYVTNQLTEQQLAIIAYRFCHDRITLKQHLSMSQIRSISRITSDEMFQRLKAKLGNRIQKMNSENLYCLGQVVKQDMFQRVYNAIEKDVTRINWNIICSLNDIKDQKRFNLILKLLGDLFIYSSNIIKILGEMSQTRFQALQKYIPTEFIRKNQSIIIKVNEIKEDHPFLSFLELLPSIYEVSINYIYELVDYYNYDFTRIKMMVYYFGRNFRLLPFELLDNIQIENTEQFELLLTLLARKGQQIQNLSQEQLVRLKLHVRNQVSS